MLHLFTLVRKFLWNISENDQGKKRLMDVFFKLFFIAGLYIYLVTCLGPSWFCATCFFSESTQDRQTQRPLRQPWRRQITKCKPPIAKMNNQADQVRHHVRRRRNVSHWYHPSEKNRYKKNTDYFPAEGPFVWEIVLPRWLMEPDSRDRRVRITNSLRNLTYAHSLK